MCVYLPSYLRTVYMYWGSMNSQGQCLELRQRTLGEEHPSTFNSLNGLAEANFKMGQLSSWLEWDVRNMGSTVVAMGKPVGKASFHGYFWSGAVVHRYVIVGK